MDGIGAKTSGMLYSLIAPFIFRDSPNNKGPFKRIVPLLAVFASCGSCELRDLRKVVRVGKEGLQVIQDYLYGINAVDNLVDTKGHEFILALGSSELGITPGPSLEQLFALYPEIKSLMLRPVQYGLISSELFCALHNILCMQGSEYALYTQRFTLTRSPADRNAMAKANMKIITAHFIAFAAILRYLPDMEENAVYLTYDDVCARLPTVTAAAQLMRRYDDLEDLLADAYIQLETGKPSPNLILCRLYDQNITDDLIYTSLDQSGTIKLKNLPEPVGALVAELAKEIEELSAHLPLYLETLFRWMIETLLEHPFRINIPAAKLSSKLSTLGDHSKPDVG
jgi:hypothetical protein